MNPTRCRPGDLALLLKGVFAGSTVTTIELESEELLREIGVIDRPVWRVDRFLDWGCGEDPDAMRLRLAPDSALLPIHPQPDPCEIKGEGTGRGADCCSSGWETSGMPQWIRPLVRRRCAICLT